MKEADVALFLQVTRIRKIRKNALQTQLVDYCPKQDDHKATKNLATRNKRSGSKSTNHESQTMTFWTRAGKHVFPKKSAKMIDGTEKPKIPSGLDGVNWQLTFALGFTDNWQRTCLSIIFYKTRFQGLGITSDFSSDNVIKCAFLWVILAARRSSVIFC